MHTIVAVLKKLKAESIKEAFHNIPASHSRRAAKSHRLGEYGMLKSYYPQVPLQTLSLRILSNKSN